MLHIRKGVLFAGSLSVSTLGLLACQQPAPPPQPQPQPIVQGGGPKLVEGPCETIFNNWNNQGVANNAAAPTFALKPTDPNILCYIDNYHWNNGAGSPPGQIGLQDATGLLLGPWPAKGTPGQGGVPNANWRAPAQGIAGVALRPNLNYTVVDTNARTWSQNAQSGGLGFSRVWVMQGN